MSSRDVPAVSRAQMIEVDRLGIEEYGLGLLQMMENASLCLSEAVRRCLGGSVYGRRVVIVAGSGNNGGGGLAAARRLSTWGARVEVLSLSSPEVLSGAPAAQLRTLQHARVPVKQFSGALPPCDVLVDSMVGYSLDGPLREPAVAAAESMRLLGAPVVALDLPSGIDADTGEAMGVAIEAAVTVTLALPKRGLLEAEASRYVGWLLVADIGIPLPLYERIGLHVPEMLFSTGPLVRLDSARGTP